MKKYFLLLFIFCFQFAPAKAQWVTIPDTNFVNYLQWLYPNCMNGNLMNTSCAQISNATDLIVEGWGISDLTGLEYFSNLDTLNCANNNLTSLPPLPGGILYLDCSMNQLTSLPPLPPMLLILNCYANQLTYLPNIPSSLDGLDCSYNQLITIPQLPDTMFNVLYINNNNISCLTNLPSDTLFFGIPLLSADISNNPLTCVPNQTGYSLGLPLCVDNDPVNNPNNCTSTINISGQLFTDQNSNCSYDVGDLGSNNMLVNLYNSSNVLIAQNNAINGTYGFVVNQPDSYKVKLGNNNLPITMACAQADSQIINLASVSIGISNINFPVQCNAAYDVYTQSVNTQGWVFPGQTHLLKTNITSNEAWYNLDCGASNYSGTVSINVTGPVTYIAPANNALTPTVNGNSFTYNITDLSTLIPASFGLQLLTDTTAQANDQICVHVEIDPTPIDADTTNNSYDFCYQVLNSYDPNMKEVYPVNVLPGYDDWFTYTIHFQNTGNAPAFNIRLRDTLDTNLDLNTFEIRGYSHPAIVSINGNILTVRFNNIMLPDSTTDYESSMGYFQYRIKPLPNLPLGTQIENTPYIYFDYNVPIVTNTTQNNFQTVVSTKHENDDANQLSVFPNPANEMLNINLHNASIENCIISNAIGQIVYNGAKEINAHHKIQLNISNLNAGVYFVKVRSSAGSYAAKFIKSE